jgi:hypothetical protein
VPLHVGFAEPRKLRQRQVEPILQRPLPRRRQSSAVRLANREIAAELRALVFLK